MAVAPKSGEFQEGRLWFTRKGNLVTLGITDLAADEIGEVQSVELPEQGDDFDKGDVVLTVDGSRGKIEVTAPAAGLVEEINVELAEDPTPVSDDPTEAGWIVKLEIQDVSDLKEFAEDGAEED